MAIRVKRKPSDKLKKSEKFTPSPSPVIDVGITEVGDKPDLPVDARPLQVIAGDPVIKVSSQHLRTIAALGQQVESLGTIRIANGLVLVSSETAVHVMKKFRTRLDEDQGSETIHEDAKAIAAMGNTVAKLSKEFRQQNETNPKKTPRKRTAFAPGKAIQVNAQHVQINNGKDGG